MLSGGGPACLRIRVVLTQNELATVNPRFMFTKNLYEKLVECVNKHYRTELVPKDFADPKFFDELMEAQDAIERIFEIQ